MVEKKISKILFIDSSIFINCAFEEVDGSNIRVLEDINKIINEDKALLLLPEVLEIEVNNGILLKFLGLKEKINKKFSEIRDDFPQKIENKDKGKVSGLFIDEINKAKIEIIKNVEKRESEILKVVKDISKNKNTKIINLDKDLIITGIERALLQKAPWSNQKTQDKPRSNSKPVHTVDRDCIIFESVIKFLKSDKINKTKSLIFCVDDIDYTEVDNKPKKDILVGVEKICKGLKIYRDPLIMLKEEFKEKYKKKDIDNYKEKNKSLITKDNGFSSPYYKGDISDELWRNRESISFSALNMFDDNIKYCQHCGKDVGEFIKNTGGINRISFWETAGLLAGGSYIIFCPFCGNKIK